MRLTLHTDYALRVLMFAAAKGNAMSTIAEIVERFDISRGHVMKVVHRLGQKGYLETIRGKKGGMRLARKPAQINVGAVVRDMEEELAVLGCLEARVIAASSNAVSSKARCATRPMPFSRRSTVTRSKTWCGRGGR
jgi:Rrf2 family nitric oxide-sensitive transcriptional repressor